jgi:putative tricarboxylic transport membrane protein
MPNKYKNATFMMKRRDFGLSATSAAALLLADSLRARPAMAEETWAPNRPVEVIVGTDPGSGFDRTARILQKIWQTNKIVEQTVTVVNKPGGFGAVGWDYMNQRGKQGNIVAIISPLLLTNNITGNMALSYRETTPLCVLEDEEIVLAVYSGSAIQNGHDLIERLRKDPASVSVGVSGIGGQNHLALALMAEAAGGIDISKLKVVGFAGSGDVTTAVIGGHVEATASPASTVAPQVQAGRMRAIGVSSEGRLRGTLAPVPTWREQGIDTAFSNWRGVVGPKGLTAPQVAYWNGVFERTIKTADWKEEVEREKLTEHYLDSAGATKFVADQDKRLSATMAKLGLAKSA